MRELKLFDFIEKPSVIFNDNQGCLSSIENGGSFKRNKHYRIRLNRCSKAVADKMCTVQYKSTSLMIADCLTKQLSRDNFVQLRSKAGLIIDAA